MEQNRKGCGEADKQSGQKNHEQSAKQPGHIKSKHTRTAPAGPGRTSKKHTLQPLKGAALLQIALHGVQKTRQIIKARVQQTQNPFFVYRGVGMHN